MMKDVHFMTENHEKLCIVKKKSIMNDLKTTFFSFLFLKKLYYLNK